MARAPSSGDALFAGGPASSRRVRALNGRIGRYPWRLSIMTTIFWIGERPSSNNPVPNDRSSWDPNWSSNYGGCENNALQPLKEFFYLNFFFREQTVYVALPLIVV